MATEEARQLLHPESRAPLDSGLGPNRTACRRPPTVVLLDGSGHIHPSFRGILRPEDYRVVETERSGEILSILENENADLLILDAKAPGIDGQELCRTIKTRRQTRLIPILVLAGEDDAATEVASRSSGADDFLILPVEQELVRTHIQTLLRHKADIDALEDAESVLFALAQAIEQRDTMTRGHCGRLAAMSVRIGRYFNLSPEDGLTLYRGAFLHDIGKISVPDSILFKPGPLTPEEWRIMRLHPVNGEAICRHTKSLSAVLPIIRSHHERLDGTGYPDGLKGEDIPLLARILQVADIFDALTSERPYKRPVPPEQAIEILESEARRGWRDQRIVAVFKQIYRSTIQPGEALWPPADPAWVSLENMRSALLRADLHAQSPS